MDKRDLRILAVALSLITVLGLANENHKRLKSETSSEEKTVIEKYDLNNNNYAVPNNYYLYDNQAYKIKPIFKTEKIQINGSTYVVDFDEDNNIVRIYQISNGVYCAPEGTYLRGTTACRLPEINNTTDSAIILVSPEEMSDIISVIELSEKLKQNESDIKLTLNKN